MEGDPGGSEGNPEDRGSERGSWYKKGWKRDPGGSKGVYRRSRVKRGGKGIQGRNGWISDPWVRRGGKGIQGD